MLISVRLFKEALIRLYQIIIGNFIFDFPLFLSIRLLGYKLLINNIGKECVFARNVLFYVPHGLPKAEINIGDRVNIAANVQIDCSSKIFIKNEAWIAQNVQIFNHIHEIHSKKIKRLQNIKTTEGLVIGEDSWIAASSIILPTVTYIGNGAIIGAGSVVTKNVDDYSIVAGNPARVIGYRKD